jgi:hypothetical protein
MRVAGFYFLEGCVSRGQVKLVRLHYTLPGSKNRSTPVNPGLIRNPVNQVSFLPIEQLLSLSKLTIGNPWVPDTRSKTDENRFVLSDKQKD